MPLNVGMSFQVGQRSGEGSPGDDRGETLKGRKPRLGEVGEISLVLILMSS